ncbi:hypothetical protein LHX58_004292 [Salmonella enterica]|uniref:hypothetical protein n=1 Tax=Salmonella enterica TaxID=28901 RepID=UPI0009ADC4AA|nr:hypothetical protein [Salmonella enterica]EBP9842109.1 hypothetical protein [Salmonella enterica subsp. enterica]EBF9278244.1 hypothetical protein [Salmonella enterica]EBO0021322.1 hypothetical protein [Salmonella enterica]EBQ8159959.1 hypothetical protein [Salmonella enterica]EII9234868.1 hypothetical protein [Salmonella enterica]
MKERGITDGLTMNQLAERNAEHVATIAALEARYAALAAENAGLKYQEPTLPAMMACLEAFYADEDVPERAMMAAYNILRKSISTPDTDAILAEVRAQGVEMFSEKFGGGTQLSDMVKEVAKDFAAQLRKGVQS